MPSETKVDIWNRALDRIGETETIEDEKEDRLAAAVCRRHYDDVLGEILEDYPWPFAKYQAQLAELAGVSRAGWAHVYALPADHVAPRAILYGGLRVGLIPGLPGGTGVPLAQVTNSAAALGARVLAPGATRIPYELQSNDAGDGQVFCTDVDLAEADGYEYTRLITVVAAYPRLFADALVWRLAVELALGIRKDRKLAQDLSRAFDSAVARAFTSQLRGRQEDPEPEASSIRARR